MRHSVVAGSSQRSLPTDILDDATDGNNTRYKWRQRLRLKTLSRRHILNHARLQVDLNLLPIGASQYCFFAYQHGQTNIYRVAIENACEAASNHHFHAARLDSGRRVFTRRATPEVVTRHQYISYLHVLCEFRYSLAQAITRQLRPVSRHIIASRDNNIRVDVITQHPYPAHMCCFLSKCLQFP